MGWLLNGLAVFIVTGILVKEWRAQADADVPVKADDNVEAFSLLCRIYNVAKHPPTKHVDTKDYQRIVEEIDTLSVLVSRYERVNTKTKEAKLAQQQLVGVSGEAHKILEEVKNVNPEGEAEKAKEAFNSVIFGEQGKEEDLCHGPLRGMESESRITTCGGNNPEKKGESSGKNLIVDFFCLCAQPNEDDEGVAKVCGVSVGTADCLGWGTKLYQTDEIWREVKKGCEAFGPQSTTSTQDGHSIYREFLDKIAVGGKVKVKNSDTVTKPGMLGTAVSDTGKTNFNCNGKKTVVTRDKVGSGSCVFYGVDKLENNTAWLKQFKTGLEIIDKLNNKTASWQSKLTTLINRARGIYEGAKKASQKEEEDIEEPKAAPLPNQAENETAESTTPSKLHRVLSWVLLLY
ncbi:Variant surface glycoprotein [Trypanosoma congolense IL3000]|uniref:Variant surface glycoprotein n=1 Tax=Trypanosoma congolense (strain IL3000) TaxID=1068625 RepID=F9W7I9_TRYCI|nr:Variant surface glycoprotein [Trypanosoma congolense IL3000]